ncbi:glycosyltransferase family 4 protein [Candidatus Roizmanbacteria bacterium]|nr:glycosyltransferase family 4 protein [Candidatus Roizmanbacteria bacterium]
MNILFLSRKFYPDIGGVEKHVLEISKRLTALGHRVTVISEGKLSDEVLRFEKASGIKMVKIYAGKSEKKKKIIIWQWLFKHQELIKNADVIHCHDVFYWYLPFRFLFPKKPVYTTFHGYESFPIYQKAIIVRKISEKLSWGNICIGDFIKKWYGTKPTFVSYGAVNSFSNVIAGRNDEAIPSSMRLPRSFSVARNDAKRESAVFIGRLDEQTGILTYLKAFERLKKRLPNFKFLVIGDGRYRNLVMKKTKVLGWQKKPEKYFIDYRFAFVSRYLSILEAFATKRLVFAVFDNPVKEDYLKLSPFAKFMIIEHNAEDLAKSVEEVLDDPQKEKELINYAYNWVKNQTWEDMTKLYLKLWKVR